MSDMTVKRIRAVTTANRMATEASCRTRGRSFFPKYWVPRIARPFPKEAVII